MSAWRREGGLLALATLVWCVAWSADVAEAWRDSPHDRWGWWAALGWAAGVAVTGMGPRPISWRWLSAAWLLSFVGVAGELNVAQHTALACAGAAWAGGGRCGFWLLALAPGWMPATGWLARGLGAEGVLGLRLLAGAGGLWWSWREWRRA